MQRVEKCPESPKTIEKLEPIADHDLENIQNVTPNLQLINTPLFYRKDGSGGHSSNVWTDDRFTQEEALFFKERAG